MRYVYAIMASVALLLGTAMAQVNQNTPPVYDQPANNGQVYNQPENGQVYNQPTNQPYGQVSNQPYNGQVYNQARPYGQPYGQNVIPAGTQVSIRTNEAIQANQNNAGAGQTYSAEIAQNILGANGQVLVPRGSQATLAVVPVNGGVLGKLKSNQVALALQSLTANGRTYNVQSTTQNVSGNRGIGANKRTAEMTGGGALLGTLIGAVAGGGKGAIIGAVVGGAGGAAAQVLTKGSNVNVPAESLLTFRLDQPIALE